MNGATKLAVAWLAMGTALFLSSWPVYSNWLASGGCGPLASCAFVLPFSMRIAGLAILAVGGAIWFLKGRHGSAPSGQ
jgi:hypothetical protein